MNSPSVISSSIWPGATPFLLRDAAQFGGQAGVAELHRRKVDRDREVGPAARRPAGLAKGEQAHLADHAAFLGDRNDLAGMKLAERRMRPAHQPFEADHRAARADHGLIMKLERRIGAAQLGAQVELDLVAALDVGVHRLGEDAEAIAARRLGAVHGDVGLAHQLGGFGDFLGREHRADADADPRLAVADHEGLADDADDPLAEAAHVGLAFRADLDDREFVAADARDGVGLAHQAAQPIADLGDQPVAGIVAERVVDLLEAVEIEHQQRDLLAGAAIAGQRLIEPVLEQGAIGEPGELIVQRLMLGGLLTILQLLHEIEERAIEEGHDQNHGHGRGQRDRPDRAEQFQARIRVVPNDADRSEVRQNERRDRSRHNRWTDFA